MCACLALRVCGRCPWGPTWWRTCRESCDAGWNRLAQCEPGTVGTGTARTAKAPTQHANIARARRSAEPRRGHNWAALPQGRAKHCMLLFLGALRGYDSERQAACATGVEGSGGVGLGLRFSGEPRGGKGVPLRCSVARLRRTASSATAQHAHAAQRSRRERERQQSR